jgi:Uma2 family endonuclease
MNIQIRPQASLPRTPDEFLRWNEDRDGKREFVRGRVVEMMIHVTRNHIRLATSLVVALGKRLDMARYDIGSADFAVRTPDGIRYPDVFVDRRTAEARGNDLAAIEPVFLAEILSPSSLGRDFIEKLSDYEGIVSARHYLILSQDEPRVWLWTKGSDGWGEPEEITGEEAVVTLSDLDATLPLAELYAGIEPRR